MNNSGYMKTLRILSLVFSVTLSVSCAVNTTEDARIEALISEMTFEEKVGQLNQITSGPVEETDQAVRSGWTGSILNEVDPARINELQRIAVEESRMGIPLLMARDVIHGYKTIFPIPLGLAATFDPELVRSGARLVAEEATASGIRWTFSPMVDVSRDPRWGRIAESSGEDTYLNSVMGAAMVRGYQGDSVDSTSMAACVKHFIGYGAAEGGRDYNSTSIPPHLMRNVYMPPFKACVDAGVMTVMTSFNDNDGVPSTGNRYLLTDVLRDEWGFDGMVVTDWASAAEMVRHGFAEDNCHAAEIAMNAGVDMDMMSYAYTSYLADLVKEGKVSEKDIDNAVRNVLKLKFRLGLFEHPYVDESAAYEVRYNADILAAAEKSAEESAILLKNDGILPVDLSGIRTILVTGPMADAPYDQMGTWVFDGEEDRTVTPLSALKDMYGDKVEIIYQPGLDFCRQFNGRGIEKAVSAAASADVILVFLGEESIMSGEAHSLADISLKGAQKELLKKLHATGKPLVLTIMAGRPLSISEEAGLCDALLYSFHPGTMGGPAIARLLTGDAVPSGKTPVSFPAMPGQIPVYYSHNNTGRPFQGTETLLYDTPVKAPQTSLGNTSYWLDAGFDPLFPFGYGLSYTTFSYSLPELDRETYSVSDTVKVTVSITNTGKMTGTEVMQLYVCDLFGSLTRPVKELKSFRRITLEPGEETSVTFDLPVSALAFYGQGCTYGVEPGEFRLWVSGDSASGTPVSFTVNR